MCGKKSFFFAVLLVAALMTLTHLPSGLADWSDSFDGGLEQDWVFQGLALPDGVPSPSFFAGAKNDRLELSDTSLVINGGANVGFGVVPGESFSDVLVSGTLNPTNSFFVSPTLTLLARANLNDLTFYAAEVKYDSAELIIFRGDGLAEQTNLESIAIPSLLLDSDVYLEFRLEGGDLTATVYDESGGLELASVSAMDTQYSTGLSGVLAFDGVGGPLEATYDDVSSVAIVGTSLACNSDGDSDCDLTDMDAFYAAFGQSTPAAWDFDLNQTIGEGDIDGWLAAASVPENQALLDPNDTLVKGDLNFSGDVNSKDLGTLLNSFSVVGGVDWASGDLNGDDQVQSTDLGLLLNQFGFTSASASAAAIGAAVPEPNGISVMLLCALVAGALGRRTGCQRRG